MSTFEKFLGTSLLLIFVYLVLKNSAGAAGVLSVAGTTLNSTFRTLQGR